MSKVSLFWFRRDLRLEDNHGLFEALRSGNQVVPLFIFDEDILSSLKKEDHRVTFIHNQLLEINEKLQEYGSSLLVKHGKTQDIFRELLSEYDIDSVYTNRDYEPYAKKRDHAIKQLLEQQGVKFFDFKDQVIFETNEVVKDDGKPYVVYTPYKNKWREKINLKKDLTEYMSEPLLKNMYKKKHIFLSLEDIGFTTSALEATKYKLSKDLIHEYSKQRDYPARNATSGLGVHLRFGTVSIRKIMNTAYRSSEPTFANELIWREFFMQILWHFPYTKDRAFREKYDYIQWRNNKKEFELWKKGQTGYPLVDAGMRELNQTGCMHNRVRMVVASFLCKNLLIDWRWGEQYFAEKLFDYEMASNVGNWQWAAGTGVDAAPYFRIFNPESQMKKFDPEGQYVRTWVPEYFGIGYVSPMVDHKETRTRALGAYKEALEDYKNK